MYQGDQLIHRVRTHASAVRWLREHGGTGVIALERNTQEGITADVVTTLVHSGIYVDGALVEIVDHASDIRSYAGKEHS